MENNYSNLLIDIRKIIRSINLESKRIEKEYGVSIPQLLTLNYLKSKPEYKATPTEIKNFLNLNASTVTGIVQRLEKKGFLARLPKMQGDKRVSHIVITSNGASLLDKIPPLMQEKLMKKLAKLPPDKINQLNEAIHMLVEIMDIDKIDAAPMLTINDPIVKQ